ncbi:tetratricopeptide repeat protein [Skeletonema marinoi]|uniref:Tetratricopeptide repeat protein n=1 Tax=Skeletonema marinoi TaxID=267567 RepID=A0AAD8YNG9_9STRA|nr:tetratricopeptide repeat protein [Skeletonema marinoi]
MENQRQFQQRIRQDAAERNDALQGLSTWMGTLKNAKPTQAAEGTYEEIRTRGNEYFAKKEYSEAVECYTHCLESKESLKTPVIFSNRALAHLKQNKFGRAEEDAAAALRICPTHSKSYHRRSVARLSLGKLRGALLDVYAAEASCDTTQTR